MKNINKGELEAAIAAYDLKKITRICRDVPELKGLIRAIRLERLYVHNMIATKTRQHQYPNYKSHEINLFTEIVKAIKFSN
jgi:hypothetical protein